MEGGKRFSLKVKILTHPIIICQKLVGYQGLKDAFVQEGFVEKKKKKKPFFLEVHKKRSFFITTLGNSTPSPLGLIPRS